VLGRPEDFAAAYYRAGADELLYQDVVASLYERNSLSEIVTKTAREMFIPLTVGGGLRSVEDIRRALRAGADKVSLNTAAVKNPQLIREASREFGASTITISVEAIRHASGEYFVYTDNGRDYAGREVFGWLEEVEALGAGEVLLTSVDREGTGEGYDLTLIKEAVRRVSIPVIACGGAGTACHVAEAFQQGEAHAVAVASLFHYGRLRENNGALLGLTGEGNTEFLRGKGVNTRIQGMSVGTLKEYLKREGVSCRIPA
jgi:cyclase